MYVCMKVMGYPLIFKYFTEQFDQTDIFENKTFGDSSIAFDNPGIAYNYL